MGPAPVQFCRLDTAAALPSIRPMIRFRPLLSVLLALSLALTSATMAVARGQARSGEWMVICSDGGAVSVQVDADGRALDPRHLCPECLSGFAALPVTEAPALARPATRTERLPRVAEVGLTGRTWAAFHARGPPSLA